MIVQHMGGEIYCYSELGKGSTFDFHVNVGYHTSDKGLSDDENCMFE